MKRENGRGKSQSKDEKLKGDKHRRKYWKKRKMYRITKGEEKTDGNMIEQKKFSLSMYLS